MLIPVYTKLVNELSENNTSKQISNAIKEAENGIGELKGKGSTVYEVYLTARGIVDAELQDSPIKESAEIQNNTKNYVENILSKAGLVS